MRYERSISEAARQRARLEDGPRGTGTGGLWHKPSRSDLRQLLENLALLRDIPAFPRVPKLPTAMPWAEVDWEGGLRGQLIEWLDDYLVQARQHLAVQVSGGKKRSHWMFEGKPTLISFGCLSVNL